MSQDRAARKQAMIHFGLDPAEVEADEEIDLDDTSGDEEELLERPTAPLHKKRKAQKETKQSRNVKARNNKSEENKEDEEREELDEEENDEEEEDDEDVDEDDEEEEDDDPDEEEEVEDEDEEEEDEDEDEDEEEEVEDEKIEEKDEHEDEQRKKNSVNNCEVEDDDDDDDEKDLALERKRKKASTEVRLAAARKTGGSQIDKGAVSKSEMSDAVVHTTRVSQLKPTPVKRKDQKSVKPTSATARVATNKSTKKQPIEREIAPSVQHNDANTASGFGKDLDALFSGNPDFVDRDLEEAMHAVSKAHNPKETRKEATASQSTVHGKSDNAKTTDAPASRAKSSTAKHASEARKLAPTTSNELQSVTKPRKTDMSRELRIDSKADSVYDFTNDDNDVMEYDEVVLKNLYKQGDYRMCAEQTCANPKPQPRSVNVDSFTCWRVSPPTLNAPRAIVFYDFRLMRLMTSVNDTSFFEVKDHEATSNQLLWRNEINRIADKMSIDERFSEPMRNFIKEAQYYSLVTGDMHTDGDADTMVVSLHINTSRVLRDYMLYLMLEEINNNPTGGPLLSKDDERVSRVLERMQHLHKRISEQDTNTTVPIVQHVLDFCDQSGRQGQRLCGNVGMYLLPEINVVRKLALAPRDRVYLGQYLLANDIADGVCKQHVKEDATKMMRRMFGALCYLMAAYETSASAAQN
ncbi:hypothetical protein CYMTET_54414 [Cymbomonas tetramitiformis]|uniref:Uncharacterized protein n=1 Tax=Cymbomonas tetramitiformis TaxID=36881 RepID=A0AAE0BGC7_9CHLO|nr:hypothetical protein CYMTET_54414 [Cymbomonas tetramitiformis]|eukprot:gene4117-5094_t